MKQIKTLERQSRFWEQRPHHHVFFLRACDHLVKNENDRGSAGEGSKKGKRKGDGKGPYTSNSVCWRATHRGRGETESRSPSKRHQMDHTPLPPPNIPICRKRRMDIENMFVDKDGVLPHNRLARWTQFLLFMTKIVKEERHFSQSLQNGGPVHSRLRTWNATSFGRPQA